MVSGQLSVVSGQTIVWVLIFFDEAGVSKISCCFRRCLTLFKSSSNWATMLVNLAEPSHLFIISELLWKKYHIQILLSLAQMENI